MEKSKILLIYKNRILSLIRKSLSKAALKSTCVTQIMYLLLENYGKDPPIVSRFFGWIVVIYSNEGNILTTWPRLIHIFADDGWRKTEILVILDFHVFCMCYVKRECTARKVIAKNGH